MPELNINVLLTFAAYAVITGLLNLLLSERSRVDAWAEAHPRVAGLLKILRGLGLDPWHLVAAASLFAKGKLPKPPSDKGGGPGSSVDDTVSLMPEPVKLIAQDRSRLHNDIPDEPAEFRSWDWRPALLLGLLLAVVTQSGCSAFRSVTPADRADAYAAQARATELTCKAYRFDRASGLVGDVPTMAKLCAGE